MREIIERMGKCKVKGGIKSNLKKNAGVWTHFSFLFFVESKIGNSGEMSHDFHKIQIHR